MTTDEKTGTTSLKRGMPVEQNNGLFGSEDRIMALGVKGRFTAVVTVEVADIVHSDAECTARPVVEFVHIEPTWAASEIEQARGAQESAYKERTGANQLNFDDLGKETANARTPDADDAAFEAAAPKKPAAKK